MKCAGHTAGNQGERTMNHFIRRHAALLPALAATLALATPAFRAGNLKLGIVTFLSGPAADSFWRAPRVTAANSSSTS